MIDQPTYRKLKTRLSRLENKLHRSVENHCLPVDRKDDPRIPVYKAILEETEHALAIFERDGFPDAWARWRNAADDASWQLGRFYPDFDEHVTFE